jgi:GxxExxY protein
LTEQLKPILATALSNDIESQDSEALQQLTQKIIGCAIEVHRHLGPGLLEATYEAALSIELSSAGLKHVRQALYPVVYKTQIIGEYRLDLIVEDRVVIEIKSVERFDPIFEAQVLTYLRVTGKRVGLLINFNSRLLKNGVRPVNLASLMFAVSLRLCDSVASFFGGI